MIDVLLILLVILALLVPALSLRTPDAPRGSGRKPQASAMRRQPGN